MEGEVLRDDQWERLREFVPGGRKPKRFGDVARRFVSRRGGNIVAFQSDAIHVSMLQVLRTYRETGQAGKPK